MIYFKVESFGGYSMILRTQDSTRIILVFGKKKLENGVSVPLYLTLFMMDPNVSSSNIYSQHRMFLKNDFFIAGSD